MVYDAVGHCTVVIGLRDADYMYPGGKSKTDI